MSGETTEEKYTYLSIYNTFSNGYLLDTHKVSLPLREISRFKNSRENTTGNIL